MDSMKDAHQNKNAFHLAGIIPVASSTSEFNLPSHDVLMPLAPNYNLVERSIAECSFAGCESIWIVCNDDIAPLIRHRVGERVDDLASAERGAFVNHPSEVRVSIPIYYVPIHPKHRDKIDCYAWSILHGANVAYWLCRRLSRWAIPDRYFVSFPFGGYNPLVAKKARKDIASFSPFYFSHEGRTVRDGLPAGFTFDACEWRRARDVIKKTSKAYYPPATGEMPSKRLPAAERHQSRHFQLGDVFGGSSLEGSKISELSWFYDLTTWREYSILLTSGHHEELVRPRGLSVSGKWRN